MKTQMKCQKRLCLILLILAALSFVVALGYSTGVLNGFGSTLNEYAVTDPQVNSNFAVGGQLYIDAQSFNDTLMYLGIVLILAVVVLYITGTQSRRNYYISNYVASIAVAILFFAISLYVIINNASILSQVNEVLADEEAMAWYAQRAEFLKGTVYYSENIVMLIICFVVYIFDILGAVALALNLVWKILLMKGEKMLIQQGKIEGISLTGQILENDISRYKSNGKASIFVYFALVFEFLYFLTVYGQQANNNPFATFADESYVYTYMMGISVILNLVVLLGGFLASQEIKNYNKTFCYFVWGVAIVQLIRILIYPLQSYTTTLSSGASLFDKSSFIFMVVWLVLSAACFVASGVMGYLGAAKREKYIKELESGEIDLEAALKEDEATEEVS